MEIKYKFISYYKYAFVVELSDGTQLINEEQNPGDIYRMDIEAEGVVQINQSKSGEMQYSIDGYQFYKI